MLIGVVTIAVNCDANERMAPRLALPVEGSATGSSTSGLAVARAGVAKFKVDWPVIEKGTFMARLGAPPLLATSVDDERRAPDDDDDELRAPDDDELCAPDDDELTATADDATADDELPGPDDDELTATAPSSASP